MKTLCTILAAFVLAFGLHAEEVRTPRAAVPLGDVTLTDGTVLKDVRLLNATPAAVTLRHSRGLSQHPLRLVPQEVLAPHAETIKRWLEEYARDARISDQARREAFVDKQKAQNRLMAGARASEIENARAAEKQQAAILAEAERLRREEAQHTAARAEMLARSHGGLFVLGIRARDRSLILRLKNVDTGGHRFDWRAVRFRTAAGRDYTPSSCRSEDRDTFHDLRAGQERSFALNFLAGRIEPAEYSFDEGKSWHPLPAR